MWMIITRIIMMTMITIRMKIVMRMMMTTSTAWLDLADYRVPEDQRR